MARIASVDKKMFVGVPCAVFVSSFKLYEIKFSHIVFTNSLHITKVKPLRP